MVQEFVTEWLAAVWECYLARKESESKVVLPGHPVVQLQMEILKNKSVYF